MSSTERLEKYFLGKAIKPCPKGYLKQQNLVVLQTGLQKTYTARVAATTEY